MTAADAAAAPARWQRLVAILLLLALPLRPALAQVTELSGRHAAYG